MIYETYGYYQSPTKTLTPSEENFLTAFMEALSKLTHPYIKIYLA